MSSKIPVGVQLWSVNKDVARDLPGTLQAIAKMGYQGVETAGLGNTPPKDWLKLLKDFGLGVAGAHVGLDALLGDAFQATLDAYGEIGCRRLNVPSTTTVQARLPVSRYSVTLTPWASISLMASASGRAPDVGPFGCRYCWLMFSWFCTISPRVELLSSRPPEAFMPYQ